MLSPQDCQTRLETSTHAINDFNELDIRICYMTGENPVS